MKEKVDLWERDLLHYRICQPEQGHVAVNWMINCDTIVRGKIFKIVALVNIKQSTNLHLELNQLRLRLLLQFHTSADNVLALF